MSDKDTTKMDKREYLKANWEWMVEIIASEVAKEVIEAGPYGNAGFTDIAEEATRRLRAEFDEERKK